LIQKPCLKKDFEGYVYVFCLEDHSLDPVYKSKLESILNLPLDYPSPESRFNWNDSEDKPMLIKIGRSKYEVSERIAK
jgi:hypothetical protein